MHGMTLRPDEPVAEASHGQPTEASWTQGGRGGLSRSRSAVLLFPRALGCTRLAALAYTFYKVHFDAWLQEASRPGTLAALRELGVSWGIMYPAGTEVADSWRLRCM